MDKDNLLVGLAMDIQTEFDKRLNKVDARNVEVFGGDIPAGIWQYKEGEISQGRTGEPIRLSREVAKLTVRKKGRRNSLDTVVGLPVSSLAGVMIGGRLFGQVGAMAGLVASNYLGFWQNTVCVDVEMKDGRKFIASMDESVYTELSGQLPATS